MSQLDKAIYAELVEQSIAGGRIYPRNVPQDVALPAVAFRQISGKPLIGHNGAQGYYESDRYQFSAVGATHDAARDLAADLERLFSGKSGELGSATVYVILGSAEVVNLMDVDIPIQPAAYETLVDVIFEWR